MLYCVVPRDLGRLHEPLRRHFAKEGDVQVVLEQRLTDRRAVPERRANEAPEPKEERRLIHGEGGRRVAERRGVLVPIQQPALPRRARAVADRLTFVERLEPSGQQLEDWDTARLITRFQSGQIDTFTSLYLRYFDRVYSYFVVALRDSHEAEDATQQLFVKLLEALPRFERRSQPFRAWLFIAVRNLALTRLGKRERLELVDPTEARRRGHDMREDADDGAAQVLDWISDPELMLFIRRLPLAQQQVLLLRYMLDLSHGEIAQILGRRADDVRGLNHRALAFLRERLAAVGRTPRGGDKIRMRRCPDHALVLRSRRFALH